MIISFLIPWEKHLWPTIINLPPQKLTLLKWPEVSQQEKNNPLSWAACQHKRDQDCGSTLLTMKIRMRFYFSWLGWGLAVIEHCKGQFHNNFVTISWASPSWGHIVKAMALPNHCHLTWNDTRWKGHTWKYVSYCFRPSGGGVSAPSWIANEEAKIHCCAASELLFLSWFSWWRNWSHRPTSYCTRAERELFSAMIINNSYEFKI